MPLENHRGGEPIPKALLWIFALAILIVVGQVAILGYVLTR
jgi:quinol-cytochrome oxidoreductase complex cytochrome b subunit